MREELCGLVLFSQGGENRTLVDYMRDGREVILYIRIDTSKALERLFLDDTETAGLILKNVIDMLRYARDYSNAIKELLTKLGLLELSEVMTDVISHLCIVSCDVEYALVKIDQNENWASSHFRYIWTA